MSRFYGFLILMLIAAGMYLHWNIPIKTDEGGIAVPYVIDARTLLECSKCNPKSVNHDLCLNCRLNGKIKLRSGEEIGGRITQIQNNRVSIKIDYGMITIDKAQIVMDSIIIKKKPAVTPVSVKENATPEKNMPELKQREAGTNLPVSRPAAPGVSALPAASKTTPENIKSVLKKYEWVAYTPSEYTPGNENALTTESLVKDLDLLKSCGFNALLTYSSAGKLSEIPLLARQHGFDGVIMGVWDLTNPDEIKNAIQAKDYADAYCIGNEGLHFKRYSSDLVVSKLKEIGKATGRPVTTSEPLDIVLNKEYRSMWKECDFLFIIAHYFFDKDLKSKNPQDGVAWLQEMFSAIKTKLSINKPLMFKEVGFPTGGESWADEKKQKKFLKLLKTSLMHIKKT